LRNHRRELVAARANGDRSGVSLDRKSTRITKHHQSLFGERMRHKPNGDPWCAMLIRESRDITAISTVCLHLRKARSMRSLVIAILA